MKTYFYIFSSDKINEKSLEYKLETYREIVSLAASKIVQCFLINSIGFTVHKFIKT